MLNVSKPILAILLFSGSPAVAQRAYDDWVDGVHYLRVVNTAPIALRCSILDATGSWATVVILPGQFMYKAVLPGAAARWDCVLA